VGIVLEGGYDLDALADSMAALMPVLVDASTPSAASCEVEVHPLARDAAARLARWWTF